MVVTLHRPRNVDDADKLAAIVAALEQVHHLVPVILPAHPRTRKRLGEFHLLERMQRLLGPGFCDPLGYLDFLHLLSRSQLVLTDSGGVQEETTILGVPCLTLRPATERPVTVTEGTNRIIGSRPERILPEVRRIVEGDVPRGTVPELWDGKAAERIVGVLSQVVT
jgi:UDP-N-acetylglucosamine 2-epimerase (non-hydrolysing)